MVEQNIESIYFTTQAAAALLFAPGTVSQCAAVDVGRLIMGEDSQWRMCFIHPHDFLRRRRRRRPNSGGNGVNDGRFVSGRTLEEE